MDSIQERNYIYSLIRELHRVATYLENKYNIHSTNDILENKESNILFHSEMIKYISGIIDNSKYMELINKYIGSYKFSEYFEKDSYSEILNVYLNKFTKNYFKIINGHAYEYPIDRFTIKSTDDLLKQFKEPINQQDGRCPLIIKPDETSYISPNSHFDLALWLSLTKCEDLHNSVRVALSPRYCMFEISSLFDGTVPSDNLIEINYEQAEKIKNYYEATAMSTHHVKPLSAVLTTSTGFGLGKYEKTNEISINNLNTLKKICGKILDVREYKRIIETIKPPEFK